MASVVKNPDDGETNEESMDYYRFLGIKICEKKLREAANHKRSFVVRYEKIKVERETAGAPILVKNGAFYHLIGGSLGRNVPGLPNQDPDVPYHIPHEIQIGCRIFTIESLRSLEYEDPESVYTPNRIFGVYRMDLRNIAEDVRLHFGDLLVPPKAGIYEPGKLVPTLVLGKTYRLDRDENADFFKIIDPESFIEEQKEKKQVVYSEDGVRLLDFSQTQAMAQPFEKAVETFLITSAVECYLDSFVAWRRYRMDLTARSAKYFQSRVTEQEMANVLDFINTRLDDDLGVWLDNKRHNLYILSNKGSDVTVTRYDDYRIIDWEERRARGEFSY